MGRGTNRVENHSPRRFSQNEEWRLDPLPTVLLYSVKLKNTYVGCGKTRNCHWKNQYHKFPSKQNISSACFDSHRSLPFEKPLTPIWKTIGKNILTSLAYLIGDCGWMALLTRFWLASAGIFSTKYNLNIYTENSFELPYILKVIKKSNIYMGYTKYVKLTLIENV